MSISKQSPSWIRKLSHWELSKNKIKKSQTCKNNCVKFIWENSNAGQNTVAMETSSSEQNDMFYQTVSR